ncbi:MAG: helix-turn-helix transcriptional regulator [Clostridia bacterium]|nr:helix-turn-helix transcriptional regulator [Clostridia bacterium]
MICLRQEREKKKMGQLELARRSGVSQQAISLIESGERKNVGVETLYALAKALGCTLYDLYQPEES